MRFNPTALVLIVPALLSFACATAGRTTRFEAPPASTELGEASMRVLALGPRVGARAQHEEPSMLVHDPLSRRKSLLVFPQQ